MGLDGTISTFSTVGGSAVALDSSGYVLVANGSASIYRLPPGGASSTQIAGVGGYGISGDGGSALMAAINVNSLAWSVLSGAIFFADSNDNVIRELTPVSLGTAAMSVSPAGVNLRVSGITQSPLTISLNGTGTFSWSATSSVTTPSGGNWLSLVTASGTGSGSFDIQVDPTGLAPGTYAGNVTVTSSQAIPNSIVVPVSITVPAIPTLTSITPSFGSAGTTVNATLTGTNFVTGATTVTIAGTGVTANSVTVQSTTSLTAAFVIAPGTALGTYAVTASTAFGTSVSLPFTVSPGPQIALDKNSLIFTAPGVGSSPPSQTLNISNAGAGTLTWTATPSSTGNWLTVGQGSGTGTTGITVSVAAGSLAAGTYTGSIAFSAIGAVNSPIVVPVVFRVAQTDATGYVISTVAGQDVIKLKVEQQHGGSRYRKSPTWLAIRKATCIWQRPMPTRSSR